MQKEKCLMVEYKAKKEKIEFVKEVVKEFVQAVKEHEPNTRLYDAFQKEEGNSFIHFMIFENDDAMKHHQNTEYVKKFVEKLYPECEIKPVFTQLNPITFN